MILDGLLMGIFLVAATQKKAALALESSLSHWIHVEKFKLQVLGAAIVVTN